MKKLLLIMLLFITACQVDSRRKDLYQFSRKKYVLVGINPPKHFYVDLVEVDTWKRFEHVYVSKHCNSWRGLRVGDTLTLEKGKYISGGKEVEEFVNLYENLCP